MTVGVALITSKGGIMAHYTYDKRGYWRLVKNKRRKLLREVNKQIKEENDEPSNVR